MASGQWGRGHVSCSVLHTSNPSRKNNHTDNFILDISEQNCEIIFCTIVYGYLSFMEREGVNDSHNHNRQIHNRK